MFMEAKRSQAKFTCLISWAKYIGLLNKDHVKPWLDSLETQKNCAVQTYLINMDFVEGVWSKKQFKNLRFN